MWKVHSFNPNTNEIVTEHSKGKKLKFIIPEKTDKKLYIETLMEIQHVKESRLVLGLLGIILLESVALTVMGLYVFKLH